MTGAEFLLAAGLLVALRDGPTRWFVLILIAVIWGFPNLVDYSLGLNNPPATCTKGVLAIWPEV